MISSIQILRAIAVILVVLVHITVLLKKWIDDDIEPFYIGFAGVDLFFVISGFIMAMIISTRKISSKEFIIDRINRIYPIYWLYFSVLLIIASVSPHLISSYADANLLSSALLFSSSTSPLLNVSWTLVYEIYFYFVVTIFLVLFSKKTSLELFLFFYFFSCFIINIIFNLSSYSHFFMTYGSPLLFEFLFGVIVYRLYIKNIVFSGKLNLLIFLFAIGIFFIVHLNYIYIDNILTYDLFSGNLQYGRFIYFGIPSFILLYIMVINESIITSNGLIKYLQKIGDASYTIYLSHYFILVGLIKILSAFSSIQFGLYDYVVLVLVLLFITLYTGNFLYVVLEKPILSFTKNFLKKVFK